MKFIWLLLLVFGKKNVYFWFNYNVRLDNSEKRLIYKHILSGCNQWTHTIFFKESMSALMGSIEKDPKINKYT